MGGALRILQEERLSSGRPAIFSLQHVFNPEGSAKLPVTLAGWHTGGGVTGNSSVVPFSSGNLELGIKKAEQGGSPMFNLVMLLPHGGVSPFG